MSGFIVRRLLHFIPVLLAVTLLTFLIAALLPGDLAYAMLGNEATPERLAGLRHAMGLDLPLWERYLRWLGAALLQGDLGRSFRTGENGAGRDRRSAAGLTRTHRAGANHRTAGRGPACDSLRRARGRAGARTG